MAATEPLVIGPPLEDAFDEPFISYTYKQLKNASDQIFMIDAEDSRKYTYGELLERSECWAQWLRSKGFGKGDIVSISVENSIDAWTVLFGTWLSGAAANPFNYNFAATDIKIMFEVTVPDVIFCTKNLSLIEKAIELLGRDIPIVTTNADPPYIDFNDVLKMEVTDFEVEIYDSKTHVVSYMFTSGTTGIPKGVKIVDYALKSYSTCKAVSSVAEENSSFLMYSPILVTSPMFWISNTIGTAFIFNGLKTVIVPKRGWNQKDILQHIQTYKPLAWFTGHSILLDLAQKSFVREYDISSLKHVATGGTLLLANQRREINSQVFNNKVFIKHVYGSTEVGIITAWQDFIDTETDEYDSVGTIGPGVILKIIDSDGKALGSNEYGEILVKTNAMTTGLITKNRTKIDVVDKDGWFHTGDRGYYDDKQLLYIIGRIKDIMKFHGVQIAPAELEVVIDSHPDVLESCVVGKTDLIAGDIPVAFIVLKENSNVTENELNEFITENIAEVKRPREIYIVKSLPKSAVGKPLRTELEKIVNK